jgi:hypothetical protein
MLPESAQAGFNVDQLKCQIQAGRGEWHVQTEFLPRFYHGRRDPQDRSRVDTKKNA